MKTGRLESWALGEESSERQRERERSTVLGAWKNRTDSLRTAKGSGEREEMEFRAEVEESTLDSKRILTYW